MFDQPQNPQFNQYLNQLRNAASSARQGNSADSEMSLRSVAAVPPLAVVQLSLAAMNDVFSSFPPQQNSQPEQLGPYLLLVAARLLHGGLARDWESFWFCRLSPLREIRSRLEMHLRHPALHSSWLAPAVAEVSVAWSVLSKMIMVAKDQQQQQPNQNQNNNNNNNNNGSATNNATTFIPSEALAFLIDEWCGMVSSVNENIATASVYCSLVRHGVEEVGLVAKVSLGRGLSLEQHDTLREAVFDQVLPPLIFVVCETMIIIAERIKNNNNNNNDNNSNSTESKQMVSALSKLTEILHACFSFGPSVFSAEFGLDRVPTTLILAPRKFRRCLFATTNRVKGFDSERLLLCDAVIAAFDVGIHLQRETDLSLPALHCFLQLCSVSMALTAQSTPTKVYDPTYSSTETSRDFLTENSNNNGNPGSWQAGEAARWMDELCHALLSVAGFQIFTNYLPNPRAALQKNNNLDSFEQTIETGGSLLRVIAMAMGRLCSNALQKEVLILGETIAKFPDDVVMPLFKFAENLIKYHHELSVTIRKIFSSSSGSTIGESMQVEEVFFEGIDFMLKAWRDFVKVSVEDYECDAALLGTPLRGCIISCAHNVFDIFVNSRIRFVQDAVAEEGEQRNNDNNSNSSSSPSKSRGGLVASAIQSHGMDYTLSQISTVGLLGRQDPEVTCQVLSNFLGPQVGEFLDALANNPQGPAFSQTESIWYLFEIMAWLLTDDENARSDVPQQINNVALKIENEAAQAEMHNADSMDFWKEVERRVPIFGLMNGSFVYCSRLIDVVSNADGDRKRIIVSHISPLIIAALLGLFRRYAHTYIFDSDNDENSTTSRVFRTAFDSGVTAASKILQFLNWSICHFYDRDDCMKEAGWLLYALASKPHIGQWLMNDRDRCGIVCAAAVGDDSGPFLKARLSGSRRGALAGAVISACSDDSMVDAAMNFLQYYTRGFASPVSPQNFESIAETVASLTRLFENAMCGKHLGTLVDTAHPYLVQVVNVVTSIRPNEQNYTLLKNLLEFFLHGIEICSFNLSTPVISWMLHSSVEIIEMVGSVVRHSVEVIVPTLSQHAREREEQHQLALLKASTSLILCAAQWGNMNISEVINGGSSDEREQVVGRLCVDGMLLVLREARHTDLIEVPELNSTVFRLVSEIARTHTRYFLSVSPEGATILLDATHWAVSSADPELVQFGFGIMEALTVVPEAASRLQNLLPRFLGTCMHALVNGTAIEPSIQVPLSNAVFALGLALGLNALCSAFSFAVSKHPFLSKDGVDKDNRYVKIFADAMVNEVQWGADRKRRRMFASVLRRIMMVIRSADIFV